jgi:7-cyano-7-deazaguanine synthase in queuosine biosynthesis
MQIIRVSIFLVLFLFIAYIYATYKSEPLIITINKKEYKIYRNNVDEVVNEIVDDLMDNRKDL